MANTNDRRRGDIALVFTIVLGLLIGFLIKRVHIGLLIGIGLGLMASLFVRKRN